MKRVKHVRLGDGSHYGYSFYCPGCCDEHTITTKPYPNGWDFNGNEERPTFTPSIHVHPSKYLNDDGTTSETPRCHSHVTDGRIAYCVDTTHALKNQTVDLPEYLDP